MTTTTMMTIIIINNRPNNDINAATTTLQYLYLRAVPESDVFGEVTPVESIYLLLQNSRQTYAADYHDHAAQTDAPLSAH